MAAVLGPVHPLPGLQGPPPQHDPANQLTDTDARGGPLSLTLKC